VISSGWPELDCLLPASGFKAGTLCEWFVKQPGSMAGMVALWMAQQACEAHATLVVVDPERWFYPPAAAAWGVDLQRLIIVRPDHPEDALWALDQAFRCTAVQAVWSWLETLNDRWFRRFQLAAEHHGALGMLLRPYQQRGRPSWAELQLVARAVPAPRVVSADAEPDSVGVIPVSRRCLEVELIRCRGSGRLGSVVLDWDASSGGLLPLAGRPQALYETSDHETSALHLVSQLADSTASRRRTSLAKEPGGSDRA
jgi:hypothetical protein